MLSVFIIQIQNNLCGCVGYPLKLFLFVLDFQLDQIDLHLLVQISYIPTPKIFNSHVDCSTLHTESTLVRIKWANTINNKRVDEGHDVD